MEYTGFRFAAGEAVPRIALSDTSAEKFYLCVPEFRNQDLRPKDVHLNETEPLTRLPEAENGIAWRN